MKPRTTAVLFLVAAALGAFVWLYEIRGESGRKDAEAASKRLFPGVEASAVKWVELTTGDGQRARLERSDAGWTIVAPIRAPADEFAADAIVSALTQLASESVNESPQPLEVYGLAEAARDLRFRAGDEDRVLRVGKRAPVGGSTYAWVEGQQRVFTVPTHAVNPLSSALADLREKRILRFDVGSVERVALRWPDGGVVLARAEPGWRLEEPIVGPADQTTVDELLNDLSFLRASGFIDEPGPEQQRALESPERAVELTTKSEAEGEPPRRLTLVIGAREGDADRIVRGEGPALFRIPSERLHDFPREAASYRFRELSRFELEKATRLELLFQPPGAEPVTLTATADDEGWSSTPEAIEPAKLATMIDELSRLRAQKILADSMGEAELGELGLAPPRARLTVFGEDGGQLAQVDLGLPRGSEGVAARATGAATVYLLVPTVADFLPVSLEALRSGFVVKPGEPSAAQEAESEAEVEADEDAEIAP